MWHLIWRALKGAADDRARSGVGLLGRKLKAARHRVIGGVRIGPVAAGVADRTLPLVAVFVTFGVARGHIGRLNRPVHRSRTVERLIAGASSC